MKDINRSDKKGWKMICFLAFLFALLSLTWMVATRCAISQIMQGSFPNGTVMGYADGPTSVFIATPGINIVGSLFLVSVGVFLVAGIVVLVSKKRS